MILDLDLIVGRILDKKDVVRIIKDFFGGSSMIFSKAFAAFLFIRSILSAVSSRNWDEVSGIILEVNFLIRGGPEILFSFAFKVTCCPLIQLSSL